VLSLRTILRNNLSGVGEVAIKHSLIPILTLKVIKYLIENIVSRHYMGTIFSN